MTADIVRYVVDFPSLREYAQRCRQLALIARHAAVQENLLRLAKDMERQAAANERRQAARADREAG